jgi:uncharacterized membrane protein YeaQ/YmgE (transglycosylase-associated protein family)
MTLESVLVTLLVGAVCGWLATVVVARFGFGLAFNIVIGVLGGLLGTWLFPKVGISLPAGLLGAIISGTVGAILILVVVGALQGIGFVPRRRVR